MMGDRATQQPMSAHAPSGPGAGPASILAAKAIHQEVDLGAAPHTIYEALLDAQQFRALSGGLPAVISREVGGAFSLFGGPIVGRHLELVPDRLITQAWRVADWPEGVYSVARFHFRAIGTGTKISFDHTGFPADQAEHLSSGWYKNYWDGLRKQFG
jgi:activator of HSP90 ATPase